MLRLKKFTPGIAWFFLVLILICMPGDDLPKADNWMSVIHFDKWVHAGLFSVMAYLFMYPICTSDRNKKNKWLLIFKIAISISVWGMTTELIQKYFIQGRSFDLLDWAADSVGVLLALIVCNKLYLKH